MVDELSLCDPRLSQSDDNETEMKWNEPDDEKRNETKGFERRKSDDDDEGEWRLLSNALRGNSRTRFFFPFLSLSLFLYSSLSHLRI